MGAGQIEEAKYAASKAMYLAVVSGLFSTGVLFLLSEWLPVWVTPHVFHQRSKLSLTLNWAERAQRGHLAATGRSKAAGQGLSRGLRLRLRLRLRRLLLLLQLPDIV